MARKRRTRCHYLVTSAETGERFYPKMKGFRTAILKGPKGALTAARRAAARESEAVNVSQVCVIGGKTKIRRLYECDPIGNPSTVRCRFVKKTSWKGSR